MNPIVFLTKDGLRRLFKLYHGDAKTITADEAMKLMAVAVQIATGQTLKEEEVA